MKTNKLNKIKTFIKNHKIELFLGGAAVVLGGVLIYERLVPRTHIFKLNALDTFGYLFEDGWEEACDYIAKNGLEGATYACPKLTELTVSYATEVVK